MFVVLFRLLIIGAFFYLLYKGVYYLFSPKRKLDAAHEKKEFYMLDEKGNARKNFLLTYQGRLFEGEKYVGTTSESFEVISIHISIQKSHQLEGLSRMDFTRIEQEVQYVYPYAKIQWKSPVKEFIASRV
ncbi:sigma-w pathway protein ysdB [Priestia koreensis]|uniref:sigma-w pathway protein ysdB n=1 Tax=Priestia koreensis TaxID=284581 RepID=UPI00204232A4|nr:sigma-w pathway protein ysdB [Priestia koreensis]MCM3002754.1 sigma-w pathway protein ysdB [Priestia koreensis]